MTWEMSITAAPHCDDLTHLSPQNGQDFSTGWEPESPVQSPAFPWGEPGYTAWLCYVLLSKGSVLSVSWVSLAVHTHMHSHPLTHTHNHAHHMSPHTHRHTYTHTLTHPHISTHTIMHNTQIHTPSHTRSHTRTSDDYLLFWVC